MKRLVILAGAALAVSSAPVQAAGLNYTVFLSTSTSPTFSPPVDGAPPSSLAAVTIPYETYAFTVDTTGSYNLQLTTSGGFKPYLGLYSPTFVPGSPLTNVLKQSHWGASWFATGFTYSLTAGSYYVATLAGEPFAAAGSGDHKGDYVGLFLIDGPGTVTRGAAPASTAPEPATWALMLGGFGVIGAAMRRRHRTAVRFA